MSTLLGRVVNAPDHQRYMPQFISNNDDLVAKPESELFARRAPPIQWVQGAKGWVPAQSQQGPVGFSVYDGPSRMGETELACAWFGSQYTMIVNAQECITPNLRPLSTGKYRAILFDEGSWELCWRNKAMMQASPRPVVLAQSQCNDRSYQVLLFRVPMIVCSSCFWEGCKDPEARDWTEKNSVFVPVNEKVFVSAVAP